MCAFAVGRPQISRQSCQHPSIAACRPKEFKFTTKALWRFPKHYKPVAALYLGKFNDKYCVFPQSVCSSVGVEWGGMGDLRQYTIDAPVRLHWLRVALRAGFRWRRTTILSNKATGRGVESDSPGIRVSAGNCSRSHEHDFLIGLRILYQNCYWLIASCV